MSPAVKNIILRSGITPDRLPGLAAWYSADYGVLTSISPDVAATDGQTVRRWLDRSGNGYHYNQATLSRQPTLTSGAILGDNTDDYFDAVAASIPQPFTLYSLFTANLPASAATSAWNSNNQVNVYTYHSPAKYEFTAGTALTHSRTVASTPSFAAFSANGASSLSIVSAGGVTSSVSGNAGSNNIAVLQPSRSAAGSPFNGAILEMICVSGYAHDATMIDKVKKYLSRKWGIAL